MLMPVSHPVDQAYACAKYEVDPSLARWSAIGIIMT